MKIDLRLSEQEFAGKLDEVFTLHRRKSVNGFGIVVIYYELYSNIRGLDRMFLPEEYKHTKALKQTIAERIRSVTNQYFRP